MKTDFVRFHSIGASGRAAQTVAATVLAGVEAIDDVTVCTSACSPSGAVDVDDDDLTQVRGAPTSAHLICREAGDDAVRCGDMHQLLQRASRHLADTLSAMNAFFGVVSCVCAAQGRPDLSLLLLIAGAVCDGLDGAAARRFGGTRFGVLADDIADAISYAIAPAIAVAVVTSGSAGTIVGVVFGALTIARLVYFTLKKGAADTDPGTFRGLPSTVGGIVVLAAAILAPEQPALVAFCAGMAVVLMISFDAGFVHLGRAVASFEPAHRARVAVAVVVVAAVAVALGPKVLATTALWVSLTYAFAPHLERFGTAVRDHAARRAADEIVG